MIRRMKLPNSRNAYVSKEKLVDYILSATHPVGSAKAKFFRGLGFDESNVRKLEKLLLQIAKTNEVKEVKENVYGTNYVVQGKLKTPSGKIVTIATVWFVQTNKNKPSFVTAYPV